MVPLGTISIDAGVSVNNTTTAVPFAITTGWDSLLLLGSATGLVATAYGFSTTPTTVTTTAATGTPIGAALFQVPLPTGTGMTPALAIFNPTAGTLTCQVWGIYA